MRLLVLLFALFRFLTVSSNDCRDVYKGFNVSFLRGAIVENQQPKNKSRNSYDEKTNNDKYDILLNNSKDISSLGFNRTTTASNSTINSDVNDGPNNHRQLSQANILIIAITIPFGCAFLIYSIVNFICTPKYGHITVFVIE